MIGGRVLDPSALLDLASGRTVYARALVSTAVQVGLVLAVPAVALAEAWAEVEPAGRPFLNLLEDRAVVLVDALTDSAARSVGLLVAESDPAVRSTLGTAHAVQVALTRGWPVVTGRPATIKALHPDVTLDALP